MAKLLSLCLKPAPLPPMTIFSFPVRETTASRLARLAKRRELSSIEMVELAIEEFVECEEWQIAEIEAAVAEADKGDFATDDEVDAVFHKYVRIKPAQ
jgi:predicted transcriptional regulator